MDCNIEIKRKEEYKKSQWSGGITTELLIYPESSSYSDRNFKWRLSSATVEVEKSTFTHLPGISRIIMIIKGELSLHHEGHHNVLLKPFEQDSFSGDWTTKSFGKVTDFNLMMADDCIGQIEVISIDKDNYKEIVFNNNAYENINNNKQFNEITEVFYVAEGEIEINKEETEKTKIKEGDLISVKRKADEKISSLKFYNREVNGVKIIRSIIYYK